MSAATNDQLRYKMLEILYKFAQDNTGSVGLERATMKELLKVSDNMMDFNISYLEEKGLIRLLKAGGAPWWFAAITAYGMDVIEHQESFRTDLPFIQANIQNIQGNVNAPVTLVAGSQVTFDQQMITTFGQANASVEDKTGLPGEQKEEIKNYLKQLQEELERKEPDLGRIQRLWKWINENANWIAPWLTTLVLEGTKKAMGQ